MLRTTSSNALSFTASSAELVSIRVSLYSPLGAGTESAIRLKGAMIPAAGPSWVVSVVAGKVPRGFRENLARLCSADKKGTP